LTALLWQLVNSWTNIVPGHIHLDKVAEAVEAGVGAAGGTPFQFNTIAVCDGIAMGHDGMRYSLSSRDIIAASLEIMVEAHKFKITRVVWPKSLE